VLCLRPEDLRLAASGIRARVETSIFQGAARLVTALPEGAETTPFTFSCRELPAPRPGDIVSVAIEDGWLLPAKGN
jgi:hypothetical protein